MKLLILAMTLTLPAATPEPPVAANASSQTAAQNVFRDRPGCVPIPRQVAGERLEYRGNRLDQQPPAHLLLAVDRRVNGCPEATIIRRDVWAPPGR